MVDWAKFSAICEERNRSVMKYYGKLNSHCRLMFEENKMGK